MANFSDKFVGKYMRLAKQVGEDGNSCFSRHIGVLIVSEANKIVGTGYNGPPKKTPNCDNREFLENYFWPQLSSDERELALAYADKHREEKNERVKSMGYGEKLTNILCRQPRTVSSCQQSYFGEVMHDCRTCPRRMVNASSGQRLELCSCLHAESNAIDNAQCDLTGCSMFCWCPVPCVSICSPRIVQNGISEVYCLRTESYGSQTEAAKWLLNKGGVKLYELNEKDLLNAEAKS